MHRILGLVGVAMAFATPNCAWAGSGSLQEVGLPNGRLAAQALRAGDFAKAQRRLTVVRPDAANDPARIINLGNAYAGMGRLADAQIAYTTALYAPDAMLVLANGEEESSRSIARRALHKLEAAYAMR